ncbi:MAG TPA: hypothetical protein DDZ81_14925, partial [Acetobacteraceae bacterium]|nr:hypothetical protein [Acetobacteraceae bacterium]
MISKTSDDRLCIMSPDTANPASASLEPAVPMAASPRHVAARFGFGLRLHHLLFIAFTIMVAAPIAVLALWGGNTSFQNELDSAGKRNLLLARGMATTLSNYVKDIEAVFGLAFESGAIGHPVRGLAGVLMSLNVIHVCVIAPDDSWEGNVQGLSADPSWDLSPARLVELRALASSAHGPIVISNLYHDSAGSPVFYLVKPLPAGRLGVGIVTGAYLVSLQQTIAFGDNGRAVIVDGKGQVIAQPSKDWVAAPSDVAGVPLVAAMMRGEAGVGEFYSPALNDDMIAGYAVVSETGWGVMVPQPISELRGRVSQVNEMAVLIALASLGGAALLAWLMARYIAYPVRGVTATAEAVIDGNDEVAVPEFHGLVPREIRHLGDAFNTMLDGLRRRTMETRHAQRQAERSNAAKSQFLANMSHE